MCISICLMHGLRDHYPLPFHDEILDQVVGHECYIVCNGYSCYFQIRIEHEDQKNFAFIIAWGSFCYRLILFGLLNAYASFQRWMNWLFGPYLGKTLRVFMDDLWIYSSHMLHVDKLDKVFDKLDRGGEQFNPSKCKVSRDL